MMDRQKVSTMMARRPRGTRPPVKHLILPLIYQRYMECMVLNLHEGREYVTKPGIHRFLTYSRCVFTSHLFLSFRHVLILAIVQYEECLVALM